MCDEIDLGPDRLDDFGIPKHIKFRDAGAPEFVNLVEALDFGLAPALEGVGVASGGRLSCPGSRAQSKRYVPFCTPLDKIPESTQTLTLASGATCQFYQELGERELGELGELGSRFLPSTGRP